MSGTSTQDMFSDPKWLESPRLIPTVYSTIPDAAPNLDIRLWRGCSPEQAADIVKHQTAGGAAPGSALPSAGLCPTEQLAIDQVGSGGVGQVSRLVEYTTIPRIAMQFASGAIVIICIKRKYLHLGSTAEGGWVAYPWSPVVPNTVACFRYKEIVTSMMTPAQIAEAQKRAGKRLPNGA